MIAKHTPGPWRTLQEECDKPYIRIRGTIPGERYKVANVLTPVYDGVHYGEAEQTRANARLIAAAPDMLAVLQACHEAMSYMSEYDIPLTLPGQVKAAIAKAIG